jgi:hypothetical protein
MPTDELLRDWHKRAQASQHAHYRTTRHLSKVNYRLGLPAGLLSAIVGTSIFVSLEKAPSITVRIIFGMISITAAALSAAQTYLRFAERAEKHRSAGAAYGALRREIEQFQAIGPTTGEQEATFVDSLRKRFDELVERLISNLT